MTRTMRSSAGCDAAEARHGCRASARTAPVVFIADPRHRSPTAGTPIAGVAPRTMEKPSDRPPREHGHATGADPAARGQPDSMNMARLATSRIPVSHSVPLLRWGRRLPCAAMLTAFAISLGTACKRAESSAPPPPDVLVTAAVQKDVPIYSEWVGTTVGFVNAQVMPRVQGYLLKQDYQDGAYVTADQLLFAIDDRPYKDEPELQLILVDGDTYPHPGRFYVANRQVDQQTGTILLQALFPNPDTVLRPGLYAKVRAPTETRRGAVVIPQRAVQEIQGVYQVAVVGADDKVALRTVKPGEEVDGLWIVDDGLQPDERVVTEGLQKVKDGIVVRPKPDTSVPAAPAPPVQG